jgi:hypothetical protein
MSRVKYRVHTKHSVTPTAPQAPTRRVEGVVTHASSRPTVTFMSIYVSRRSGSRDSSTGHNDGLWAERQCRDILLFFTTSRPALRPMPSTGLFARSVDDSDQPLASSDVVKNAWRYTSTDPKICKACCLLTHSADFSYGEKLPSWLWFIHMPSAAQSVYWNTANNEMERTWKRSLPNTWYYTDIRLM